MIDCKECSDFVELLIAKGEIPKEESDKVAQDRHALKGCDKKNMPYLDWINYAIENQLAIHRKAPFNTPQWNKGYLEALFDCKDRYIASLNTTSTKNI